MERWCDMESREHATERNLRRNADLFRGLEEKHGKHIAFELFEHLTGVVTKLAMCCAETNAGRRMVMMERILSESEDWMDEHIKALHEKANEKEDEHGKS